MASTDYLKTLNERMMADCIEAKRVATELVRDQVLKPQSMTDYHQIHGYLQFAAGNIATAELVEKLAARKDLASRPGTLLADSKAGQETPT